MMTRSEGTKRLTKWMGEAVTTCWKAGVGRTRSTEAPGATPRPTKVRRGVSRGRG